MDKHTPTGVRNSSTFSYSHHSLPMTRKMDHCWSKSGSARVSPEVQRPGPVHL